MAKSLEKEELRLVSMMFTSVRPGSVKVEMQMLLASTKSFSNNILITKLSTAFNTTYGGNATLTIIITQSSTPVTQAPPIPDWGIAMIVIAGIVIVVTIIIAISVILVYRQRKINQIKEYIGNSYLNENFDLESTRGTVAKDWGPSYSSV